MPTGRTRRAGPGILNGGGPLVKASRLAASAALLAELAQADMGKEMVRRNFDALAVISGGGAPFAQGLAHRTQIVADLRGAGLVRAVLESFQEMAARFMLAAQGCHAHAQ